MTEENAGPTSATSPESGTDTAESPEVVELEADIARTREELADTIDQLAAKLDVKTRVHNRLTESKDVAAAQLQTVRNHLVGVDGKPRPVALATGGGVVAAVAAVILVRLWMRPSVARGSRRRR